MFGAIKNEAQLKFIRVGTMFKAKAVPLHATKAL
jgi:hypothetical protein